MDWIEAAARVVVEACNAHPDDVALDLGCGEGRIAYALAPRVKLVVGVDRDASAIRRAQAGAPPNVRFEVGDMRSPPRVEGLSVVCVHDALRFLPPDEQRSFLRRMAGLLPPRGLLVIGDVMWSMPRAQIDAPEQYGEGLDHVQNTRTLENWTREAGFLPDLHRFGPAIGVLIALRTGDGRAA